jgi:murein DD-endopeptidase MepM/ murein hydrolase activator NlpD
MTSDFGPRTPPSGGSMAAGSQGSSAHGGIDVISLNPVSSGNPGVIPIFAISDGVVESCCGSTGAWLSIDHGDGLTSQYGHMANYAVRTGDRVTRGQVVGTMGTTGNSTGVHLHFQIKQNGRTVDPMSNLGLQCSAAAKAHTSQGIHCRDGNQNMDGNGSF